ncbi:MAG: hypothetical protein QOC62_6304 [Mycobacterium sp.]|jgi:hypothetical protein|nr:hypothetical protein [Mycobacterium sp.]
MNDTTAAAGARFTLLSRLLHWSMAAMVITQLLLDVTMVASLSYYPLLAALTATDQPPRDPSHRRPRRGRHQSAMLLLIDIARTKD